MSEFDDLLDHEGRMEIKPANVTDHADGLPPRREYLWRIALTLPAMGGRFRFPDELGEIDDRDLYELPAVLAEIADEPSEMSLEQCVAALGQHVSEPTLQDVCQLIGREQLHDAESDQSDVPVTFGAKE